MSASEQDRNAEVVRRYLRVFATRDLAEPRAVMAEDVQIYGAGMAVTGRHNVEQVVLAQGLASSTWSPATWPASPSRSARSGSGCGCRC